MNHADKSAIWKQVEEIREQYQRISATTLPLDLIEFIELDLKLDLIPFDSLYRNFGADAAILADFSGIYVEGKTYDIIDTAPEWKLNRLRFSLGHELGHYFLHQSIFTSQTIDSDQSCLEWLNEHGGDKYRIEQEANEFAGRLLVPYGRLSSLFDSMKTHFTKYHGSTHWQNDIEIREKACELMAQRFGVHPKAISARLSRENLWPEPF